MVAVRAERCGEAKRCGWHRVAADDQPAAHALVLCSFPVWNSLSVKTQRSGRVLRSHPIRVGLRTSARLSHTHGLVCPPRAVPVPLSYLVLLTVCDTPKEVLDLRGRETLATMVGGGAQGEGCLEGGARDPVPNDGLVNDGLVGGLSEACRLGIHLSSNGTGFPVSGARSRSSEVGSRVW